MSTSSSVQVAVRVRPMSERELKNNTTPVVTASGEKKEITLIRGAANRQQRQTYSFDAVYSDFSTQSDVFSKIRPLVEDVTAGFEGTVRRCSMALRSQSTFALAFAAIACGAPAQPGLCALLRHRRRPRPVGLRARPVAFGGPQPGRARPMDDVTQSHRPASPLARSLPTAKPAPARRSPWKATWRTRASRG